jgi:large subunit ribosomal protein L18
MIDKKVSRQRRAKRARMKIREQGVTRLCVNRTPRHIYAQIITGDGNSVVASASTLEKDLRSGSTGNIDAASVVGKLVAERAVAAGVTSVAFDQMDLNIMVV